MESEYAACGAFGMALGDAWRDLRQRCTVCLCLRWKCCATCCMSDRQAAPSTVADSHSKQVPKELRGECWRVELEDLRTSRMVRCGVAPPAVNVYQ